MKKLFIAAFVLLLTSASFAQNGKVIAASNYLQAYNAKEGAANIDEAVKNIDAAVNDPATSGSTKAWWFRSQIYQTISSDTSFSSKYPKASLETVHSFQKMKEINDPKFKDWADAIENMKAIKNNLFNDGIVAYNKNKYHDAYLFFYGVSDVEDILEFKGQKPNNDLLIKALGNAALCAENDKDYVTASAAYMKLIPMSTDAKPYIALAKLMKKQTDTAGAKRITDEGLQKYPTDKDLLINKISFYLNEGKYNDAITYLTKAAEEEPKNEQIQVALASAYDQVKDTANSRKVYQNILTMNPNNFDANFGMGRMIYNKIHAIQDQMNTLTASKADQEKYDQLKQKRNAVFVEAKPYLDKANELKPNDPEIVKALATINSMTR